MAVGHCWHVDKPIFMALPKPPLVHALFAALLLCPLSADSQSVSSHQRSLSSPALAGDSLPAWKPEEAAAIDTAVLTNERAAAEENYPLQFGRAFIRGEIQHAPQVKINGAVVPTQADIKTRYADGSVQFAILSLIVPRIGGGEKMHLSFSDQPEVASQPLAAEQMLSPKFGFDAAFQVSNETLKPGVSKVISARDMLSKAGSCADDVAKTPTALCSYWVKGEVATTIILGDHSTNRAYDFGFASSATPVRPLFNITFWPKINAFTVRYIAEISNTEAIQDDFYAVRLSYGQEGNIVYSHPEAPHHYGSRWTKLVLDPKHRASRIGLDSNLTYLSQTGLVANFDTKWLKEKIDPADLWDDWSHSHHDIGERGLWTPYMGTVGGRPEIGDTPLWNLALLAFGDARSRDVALSQADLAANWPVHVREGRQDVKFDKRGAVPGIGKPISIYGRPSLWLFDDRDKAAPRDAVAIHILPGLKWAKNNGESIERYMDGEDDPSEQKLADPRYEKYKEAYVDGWEADGAHQPNPFMAPYLVTGDYFYLEEIQLWAASQALHYCTKSSTWCRGPGAGVQDEVRGNAWVLRNRVNAAIVSPDNSPEKLFFSDLVKDCLDLWEGAHAIAPQNGVKSEMWRFGAEQLKDSQGEPSPLHFFSASEDRALETLVTEKPKPGETIVGGGISPWMQNFLILELGRAEELGFAAGPLHHWLGKNLISQLTDPQFNPYLVQAYRMPVADADGRYFSTWGQVLSGFPIGDPDELFSQKSRTLAHDITYLYVARSALAGLVFDPSGDKAWTKINDLLGPRAEGFDPIWAISPRPKRQTH